MNCAHPHTCASHPDVSFGFLEETETGTDFCRSSLLCRYTSFLALRTGALYSADTGSVPHQVAQGGTW